MNYLFKHIILISLLSFFMGNSFSQTSDEKAIEVIKKFQKKYDVDSYQMKYRVSMISNESKQQGEQGFVYFDKGKFKSKINNSINIGNGELIVSVDDNSKIVFVSKFESEAIEKMRSKMDMTSQIDSLVKKYNYQLISNSSNYHHIKVDINDQLYKEAHLFFNKNMLLNKIIYYMKEDRSGVNEVIIEYQDIELGIAIPEATFSVDNIIEKANKKELTLIDKYKNYQLLDYRNTEF